MIYEKNADKELSKELFKNPTSEYRSAPFWALNGAIDVEECKKQVHIFKDMGFGGYHLHTRSGLEIEYLGDEFNKCIKAAVEEGKSEGLLSWLYDEDRWPSGAVGGKLTKDRRYSQRGIYFTPVKLKETATYEDGVQTSGFHLVAKYGIFFAGDKIVSYKRIKKGEFSPFKRFYAYEFIAKVSDEFNGQTYVDVLNKEAMDKFAEITYGNYAKLLGDDLGKNVPAMFTDEPQMAPVKQFNNSFVPLMAKIPWTDDFASTFSAKYGFDIVDKLPEIFFDLTGDRKSQARYLYHAHRTERFAEAFSDNLGKRCADLGIHLTGHLMEEPTLFTQSKSVGETLRHYREFGLPGMDLLLGRHEYNTAKQVQSVVRQEGKEGMTAELYGVSSWNVEFGKFKEEGDWLACLGTTVRVPHLALYSMKGEAKRDYPPSLSYQAPWYKKFSILEDHYARLNTALTRGKAYTEIAVIHPIESYWLANSSSKKANKVSKILDKRFADLTSWLLLNSLDFDFISESLLPLQKSKDAMSVGEAKYKTIIVPGCITLRSTTLNFLKKFKKAGGRVIFMGDVPKCVDALSSCDVQDFASSCLCIPFDKNSILMSLEENRQLVIGAELGDERYLSVIRDDGDNRWLFIAHPAENCPEPTPVPRINTKDTRCDAVTVSVKGNYKASLWDTLSGEISGLECTNSNGLTTFSLGLHYNDSALVYLEKGETENVVLPQQEKEIIKSISLADGVAYTLSEPNVILLDKASYKKGRMFTRTMGNYKLTKSLRRHLSLGGYRNNLQPYARPTFEKHDVTICFNVKSQIDVQDAFFVTEYDLKELVVNGVVNQLVQSGYYVDKCFKKYPISLKAGMNKVLITLPFGKYDRLENCYIAGNFGVQVKGNKSSICEMPKLLSFGDIAKQGLPFYGGKLTYHTSFVCDAKTAENACIQVDYRAALVSVVANGVEKDICFAPYVATIPVKDGENCIDLSAYVSRKNAFGVINITKKRNCPDGPKWYYMRKIIFKRRNYCLDEGGIMSSPIVTIVKNKIN